MQLFYIGVENNKYIEIQAFTHQIKYTKDMIGISGKGIIKSTNPIIIEIPKKNYIYAF
tara:strand:+ start:10455 stop:10628 length:174 start_codon:yes stop_codon:yes gene_type:complete